LGAAYPNPTVVGTRGLALPASTTTTLATNSLGQIVSGPTTLPPSGAATGDLTGSYPNPAVAGIAGATLPINTSSQINSSAAGSLTTPVVSITGAPVNGGSPLPFIYIDNAGATGPASWNTAWTMLGMNSITGAGNFLDFRYNGGATTMFSVNYNGVCSVQTLTIATGTLSLGNNVGIVALPATGAATGAMFNNLANAGCWWASGAVFNQTKDTSITRFGPGVLQIGTNATAGGSTGSLKLGQILGGSGAPTLAAGVAAGGATPTVTGNNTGGQISITPGATVAAGVIATLTFNTASPAYTSNPFPVISAANAAAAGVMSQIFAVATSLTTWTINANAALVNGTNYLWNFVVTG
jgi:hypothetical protein